MYTASFVSNKSLACAFLVLFYLLSVKVSAMDLDITFESIEDMQQSIARRFPEPPEFKTFTQKNRELFVVLGTRTSEVPTTEIMIFQAIVYKGEVKKYKLIVFRNTIAGIVKVQEIPGGLRFERKGSTVLSIPWVGIDVDGPG